MSIEHVVYMKKNYQSESLIICLYVDDLLYRGNSAEMITEFKETMSKEFEMIDTG